jgi:hypothetical protein
MSTMMRTCWRACSSRASGSCSHVIPPMMKPSSRPVLFAKWGTGTRGLSCVRVKPRRISGRLRSVILVMCVFTNASRLPIDISERHIFEGESGLRLEG